MKNSWYNIFIVNYMYVLHYIFNCMITQTLALFWDTSNWWVNIGQGLNCFSCSSIDGQILKPSYNISYSKGSKIFCGQKFNISFQLALLVARESIQFFYISLYVLKLVTIHICSGIWQRFVRCLHILTCTSFRKFDISALACIRCLHCLPENGNPISMFSFLMKTVNDTNLDNFDDIVILNKLKRRWKGDCQCQTINLWSVWPEKQLMMTLHEEWNVVFIIYC